MINFKNLNFLLGSLWFISMPFVVIMHSNAAMSAWICFIGCIVLVNVIYNPKFKLQ